MAKQVTLREVEDFIRTNPDSPAGDVFAAGSFAKKMYETADQAHITGATPQKADRAECERWGLTPDAWAESMRAVERARRHDAKLDMLKQGTGRV